MLGVAFWGLTVWVRENFTDVRADFVVILGMLHENHRNLLSEWAFGRPFLLEGCFALGRKLLIHLLDRLLDVDGVQMTVHLRLDASWMYRRDAYAITSMTPVESNGEEDIRSRGPAVGNEGFIRPSSQS